jgi:hypothetical protein
MKERMTHFAPSALGIHDVLVPGPLAQAFTFRPFGALVARRTILPNRNASVSALLPIKLRTGFKLESKAK